MASHPMIAHDPTTLDKYKTLLTQQARLRCNHLLRGKLSVLWQVYQQHYECQQRMQRRTTSISNTQTDDRTTENNNTDEINNSNNAINNTFHNDTSNDDSTDDDNSDDNGSGENTKDIPANIGRTMANNNINNEKIMANNSSTKPKPKKKRKTDQFQQFIDSAFLAARKELWIDRCDDRH